MLRVAKYLKNAVCVVAFVAAIVVCGCDKTSISELVNSEVTFHIDWSGVKTPESVTSATIHLYSESSDIHLVYPVINAKDATVPVPEGTYSVVAYNDNLSIIQMRGQDQLDSFEAYAPTVKRDQSGEKSSLLVPSVECLHLLTGTANRRIVVSDGEPLTLTLRPRTATTTYKFNVSIPTRLNFASVDAVLGGVASKMGVFEAKPLSADISQIEIPLTVTQNSPSSADTTFATGSVECFGVDPANRNAWSNTLVLDLVPVESQRNQIKTHYEIDLTEFFNKYADQSLNIDVKISSPDPEQPDVVGIEITVTPWVVEDGGDVDVEPELTWRTKIYDKSHKINRSVTPIVGARSQNR